MEPKLQIINSLPQVTALQSLSLQVKEALDTLLLQQVYAPKGQLDFAHPLRLAPDLRLLGSTLYINGVFIPLASRPLTLKLLLAFFKRQDQRADKSSILFEVYGQGHELSHRLSQSQECNLNKLISRTRKLIENALEAAPWAMNLNWLVFEQQKKIWKLCVPGQAKSAEANLWEDACFYMV